MVRIIHGYARVSLPRWERGVSITITAGGSIGVSAGGSGVCRGRHRRYPGGSLRLR